MSETLKDLYDYLADDKPSAPKSKERDAARAARTARYVSSGNLTIQPMNLQALQFVDSGLSPGLTVELRRMNPWWDEGTVPVQSKTRRDLASEILRRLNAGIAPIVMVRGLDQMGKTTTQFQVIDDLLKEGVPARSVLRVQYDESASL